ncbi:MAG: hypothetical protein ABSC95_15750 [Acetobacteraceae bacterium]
MDAMAGVFDCRAFAQIEFALGQAGLVVAGEGGKGVGRGDMHTAEIGVHPLDDGAGTEARNVARGLEEDGVGDDHGTVDVEQVIEAGGGGQSDQRTGIDDQQFRG